MMTLRILSALLPLCLVLALAAPGCSSERAVRKLTSFKDPAFAGAGIGRIAVFADTANLQWRHDLENWLAQLLRNEKIGAVESYTVLPPTRTWSAAERLETLVRKGFDAYLLLTVDGVDTQEQRVPLTSTTTITRERTREDASDSVEREKETVTTQSGGGYTVRSSRVRYGIRLIETRGGDTVWMALNDIDGNPAARLPGFCEEIVQQIRNDLPAMIR